MEINSIKKNLDKSAIISSIKLMLATDFDKKKVFLIVEGEDDWKFFRKFVSEQVTIYQSFSGKQGVLEILENEYIEDKRVVGIQDRDYADTSPHNRIFYYDFCCLEMMLLKDKETHHSVSSEFYNGLHLPDELRLKILKELKTISHLRLINEKDEIGIKFKGLQYGKCYDNGNLSEDIVKRELQLLQGKSGINIDNICSNIQQSIDTEFELDDYLKITNGHDFIFGFQHHCNINVNKGYSDSEISSGYRSSYNKNKFSKTKIFNTLIEYSQENKLDIVDVS